MVSFLLNTDDYNIEMALATTIHRELENVAVMQIFDFDTNNAPAVRNWIVNLEEKIASLPNARFGDDAFPLVHTFAGGMYIREIFMPKGNLLTSKIHKFDHPYFILKGECSVLTEDGVKRIKAPCYMITPAGTKRVLYIHEDTVWVTVHRTDGTNIEDVEDDIISKSYEDFFEYVNTKQISGEIRCLGQQQQ
jgi:hypothetical protein